jgi:DNA-binding NtrC family response regulator
MLMPNLSGIDLALQLLEHCPKCKVMLLSGDSLTAASSLQAQLSGHEFEILIKPVHPADMLSSIQRIMEGSPAQLTVNGA